MDRSWSKAPADTSGANAAATHNWHANRSNGPCPRRRLKNDDFKAMGWSSSTMFRLTPGVKPLRHMLGNRKELLELFFRDGALQVILCFSPSP
jgi:hypothetical protein